MEAFAFDRAIATFGNALTAELDDVEGKNKKEMERKRDRILKKWLRTGNEKFRDPAKG